ncbi:putative membrane-associated kinase regulator 6 [Citrus sinensis]|nr:putative membrane-associated kinase regulator 6 [Citrus sinensis]
MDNEILKEEKRSFARSDVSKGLPAVARYLAVLHMSSVDPGLTSDSSLKSGNRCVLWKAGSIRMECFEFQFCVCVSTMKLFPVRGASFLIAIFYCGETLLDGIDEPLRTSLDSSSEAISKELAENFNFDIPTSQSSAALLHADELFSDGLIKPEFVDPSKILDASTSGLITVLPGSSFSSGNVIPVFQGHYRLFSKWRISFKKNFLKCFGYLRPHCHNIGSSWKRSSRVDDIDRREREVKSSSSSPQASPPPSAKYSVGVGDWYDIENSIYEAILHCKRSIGLFLQK